MPGCDSKHKNLGNMVHHLPPPQKKHTSFFFVNTLFIEDNFKQQNQGWTLLVMMVVHRNTDLKNWVCLIFICVRNVIRSKERTFKKKHFWKLCAHNVVLDLDFCGRTCYFWHTQIFGKLPFAMQIQNHKVGKKKGFQQQKSNSKTTLENIPLQHYFYKMFSDFPKFHKKSFF